MKKNFIVKIILLSLLIITVFISCKGKKGNVNTEAQQYTCPMHPPIISDKPGQCPICGMDLVPKSSNKELAVDSSITSLAKPVNAQILSTIPVIKPESGTRIFSMEIKGTIAYDTRNQTSISSRVSGRIEKLYIKYNFQPIRQGQLIMEIYSPDLAAAQRELLFIARTGNDDNMLSKAKQRLLLLGLQNSQIDRILKTGSILYSVPVYSNTSGYILEKTAAAQTMNNLPASTNNTNNSGMGDMGGGLSQSTASSKTPNTSPTPVMIREGQYVSTGQSIFTIYKANNLVAEFALKPEMAALVKKGQKLIFRPTTDKEKTYTGVIGLIQPVVRNGENFTVARVYLNNSDLLPGQLVIANIPAEFKTGWWLPKKAVWQSGNNVIVFKKEGDVFKPMQVDAGIEIAGMVHISTFIDDWEIAANAWYLVDSESFIKTTNETGK